MLWLCAHYPSLPLEAIRAGLSAPGAGATAATATPSATDSSPLAVIESRGSQKLLTVLNAAASARGLAPGMVLPGALSLVPELVACERQREQEQALLEAEACWAYRFGNPVTLSPSCLSIWVEIGRSLKLFGGWKPLAAALLADEPAVLSPVAPSRRRLGVAPTQAAAYLLATASERPRKPVHRIGDIAAALAPLPIDLLPLSRPALDILQGSGLRRIGDVGAIPREALSARIGTDNQLALDRLFGRAPEVWASWTPPTVYSHKFDFQDPIETTEGLLFPLRVMLEGFVSYLKARGLAVQHFVIRLVDTRKRVVAFEIGLLAPTQDFARLLMIVRERLDKVRLEDAATEVTVEATRFEHQSGSQDELLATNQRQRLTQRLTELKERLIARLGSDAVREIRISADQRPEFATRISTGTTANADADSNANTDTSFAHPPRPIWMLEKPQPMASTPKLLSPAERIDLGWWQGQNSVRDYHLAEDDRHRLCWVFRIPDAPTHWFLHGLWQ